MPASFETQSGHELYVARHDRRCQALVQRWLRGVRALEAVALLALGQGAAAALTSRSRRA
jgi:hypothetical protein